MKAKDVLKTGETAMMIFTDGRNLTITPDGRGTSGVWRINKNIAPDRVIVYFRNGDRQKNEIYLGDFVQLLPSTEKAYPNRSVVEFMNMKSVGFTDSNWNEFTDTKRGSIAPVKYIK